MRTYLLDLPDDPAALAQAAFNELHGLRRAEHLFMNKMARAAPTWLLMKQIEELQERVEELEARQRRRDEASQRMWRKPVGDSA